MDANSDVEQALRGLRGISRSAAAGSTEELFADRRREAALEAAELRRYLYSPPRETQSFNAEDVRVPNDAGEYEDRLRRILLRIPHGWGRRIRVERGWYPLICELDKALGELLPRYELHQVKQKFGVLNYNWEETSELLFSDADDPKPRAGNWSDQQMQSMAWQERQTVYRERVGITEEYAELQRRVSAATRLVASVEERSMTICELCAASGIPSHTDKSVPWTMILCDDCRATPVEGAMYIADHAWRQKYGNRENPYRPPGTAVI